MYRTVALIIVFIKFEVNQTSKEHPEIVATKLYNS